MKVKENVWVVTDQRDGCVLSVAFGYERACNLAKKKYPNVKDCHKMATFIKINA